MRNAAGILSLFCIISTVHATDRLEGIWMVDEKSTLEFNLNQKSYSETSIALMKCMAKSSSLTFASSHVQYAMETHQCKSNGRSAQIDGYKTKGTYRVLASSPDASVVATTAEDGSESFDIIHHKGKNRIWIYYPGEPPEFNEHMRTYYIRKVNGN